MTPPVPGDDSKLDHPSITAFGGTIESENQILGEDLGLAGTPYVLHYSSDRVPGRRAPYRLTVRLTGAGVPPALLALVRRIDLTIDVAGQHYARSFEPAPDLSHELTWDRQDGYGREIQGEAPWVAELSYVTTLGPSEHAYTYTYSGQLGTLDAQGAQGLGGWTVSANHFFDQPNGTLYYGDGRRRTLRSRANNPHVLEQVAGTGAAGTSGDGGSARLAKLDFPVGLAVTPDGSLLIADHHACRVRRVSAKDGTISTVAGSTCGGGGAGEGDGGPATAALLAGPVKAVETIDGVLYIADFTAHRIRRVGADGVISTVAGTGEEGCTGNQLAGPHDIALAADGSLLIANIGMWTATPEGLVHVCDSIQKYTPGSGLQTLVGRQLPSASSMSPQGVAATADGAVYFTPAQAVVKRPPGGGDDPQHWSGVVAGVPRLYAGNEPVFAGDGQPASTSTRFFLPTHLAVGLDGTVYVIDRSNRRIRTISPAERVDTLVGGGDVLPVGDGLAARRAMLGDPSGIALDDERGVLYFADGALHQVWKVRLGEPTTDAAETVVPEEDGSLRYVFDRHGHHLRTEDAVTGQVLLSFTYANFAASGGRSRHLLTRIEDPFGNATAIQRGANGDAAAIVGPYGQTTTLQIDGTTGYLQQASGGGATVGVSHDADGLLRSLTDPRSGTYEFDYDNDGRLSRVADPAGGSLALTYTELAGGSGWKVRQQTAMGRTSQVEVFLPPEDASLATPLGADDRMLRVYTDAAGLATELRESRAARATARAADGTTSEATLAPDPVLKDLAPYAELGMTTTPGGLHGRVMASRPQTNGWGAVWSETVSANGRSTTTTFTEASGGNPASVEQRSPAAREVTAIVDAFGRLTGSQVPRITPVEPAYDGRGRLSSMSQGGRQSTWSYDPQGFVQSVTDPLLRKVSFERDARGRVTKQTLPDLREVGFGYDASGNLTSLTPPSRPSHTFAYDQVDQLATATPPNVLVGTDATSFAYNLDHQLELVTRPDGLTIDPAYDGTTGRLTALTTPTGTTSYVYDPASGRLARVSAPAGGGAIGYAYDGPVLTSVTQSGTAAGSIAYAHDRAADGSSNFWIASRTINGDAATSVSYQYDPDGLLTAAGPLQLHRDGSNGALTGTTLQRTGETLERNEYGEVTRLKAGWSGEGCTPLAPPFAGCTIVLDQSYVRDAAGRITSKTETVRDPLGTAGETHTYVYAFDPAGRLVQVERDGAVRETFGYDGNSNRTSWTGPWGAGTATYDTQDRLLTYGPKTYTYTANGELADDVRGRGYGPLHLRRAGQPAPGRARRRDRHRLRHRRRQPPNRQAGQRHAGQGLPLRRRRLPGRRARRQRQRRLDLHLRHRRQRPRRHGARRRHLPHRHRPPRQRPLGPRRPDRRGSAADGLRPLRPSHPRHQPRLPALRLRRRALRLPDRARALWRARLRRRDGRWTSKDPIGFAGGDTNLYGYVVGDPVNFTDPVGLAPAHDFRNLVSGSGLDSNAGHDRSERPWSRPHAGAYNSTRLAELFGECGDADSNSANYQIGFAAAPLLAGKAIGAAAGRATGATHLVSCAQPRRPRDLGIYGMRRAMVRR